LGVADRTLLGKKFLHRLGATFPGCRVQLTDAMKLTSLFTGNPHFLNLFVLTGFGIGIPMVYLHYTAPSEDEKERRSVSCEKRLV
jgi:hypothetical protein